jgi:DNA-binding NtrC family response regulator
MSFSPYSPLDFTPTRPQLAHDNTKRILLVEDDPSTRWLVRNALKDECDLMTASTGEQAVEIYIKCAPEVVFLDLNLPGKKGNDIMRMILNRDPGAFVVVISGHENIDVMLEMLRTGAKGMITKPYGRAEILNYIRNSPTLR